LIPTNDGQICVFVGGAAPDFRARVFPDLDRGFRAVLAEASPALARRVAAGSRTASYRGFAGVHGYLRRCAGPGWALVGDAGYFKDPITQHGISDALRDAELLSRAITGDISMADYQTFRDLVSQDLFTVTDRIAGYDWTMQEIRLHLMDVSQAMKAELALLDDLRERRAA
jgi:flavin-dependent dehydrogenase